jgi:hypothetical protein
VLVCTSSSIWPDAVAKLDPTATKVLAELPQFLTSRPPVLLDWPPRAA